MGTRGQYAAIDGATGGQLALFGGCLAGLILFALRYLADFGGFIELFAVAFALRTSQVLMGSNYEGPLVNVLFLAFEVLIPGLATCTLSVLARKLGMPIKLAIGTAIGVVVISELATGLISVPIP